MTARWRARFAAVLAVLCLSAPASAGDIGRWRGHIEEASSRFGVPRAWIERVIRAESGGETVLRGQPIVSRAGAMGLMQLMPATWAEMRVRLGLGANPHDPRDNILAGTFYMRLMFERFGYPGLFAAYNAGPKRYAQHLEAGRALPAETRAYVATVTGGPAAIQPVASRPARALRALANPQSGIFFELSAAKGGQ